MPQSRFAGAILPARMAASTAAVALSSSALSMRSCSAWWVSIGTYLVASKTPAFAWAAAHILPGMLLTAWLKSIGLSLELVIIVGAAVLTVLFLLIHYFRTIVLFFAPFLGGFGRQLQARWGRSGV